MAVDPSAVFLDYHDWLEVYEKVKEFCDFPAALNFLNNHPGTVNNRKGFLLGNTLLHQACFWGLAKNVFELLKQHGADPNLRNMDGHTPLDMAPKEKRAEMEALMLEVFGASDTDNRRSLLHSAKEGDFGAVMAMLGQQPHLINTQGYTGWAVVHQLAFHGAPLNIMAALASMGACMELCTHEGQRPEDILREFYPNNPNRMPRTILRIIEPGKHVFVHPVSARGVLQGKVLSASDTTAIISLLDGEEVTVSIWRVFPAVIRPAEANVERVLGGLCSSCVEPVPSSQTLSPNCTNDHPLCGRCITNFLWAQFTTMKLPMRCPWCPASVDPRQLDQTPMLGSIIRRCWPPAYGRETSISYDDFMINVEGQIAARASGNDDSYKLSLLQDCSLTDRPVEYCRVADCPKLRACPNCGVLIEYESACKHMSCIPCKHEFCFLCLKSQREHEESDTDIYTWSVSVACPVAARQTIIPQAG